MTDYTLQGSQFSSMIAAFAPPPQKNISQAAPNIMITAFSCSPYSVQACVCRLLSRSLLPREAAAWMERMSCADSIGLRWPNWDNCTGRDANQRDSTLLLQRETQKGHVNPRPPHQGLMLLHNCYSSYV